MIETMDNFPPNGSHIETQQDVTQNSCSTYSLYCSSVYGLGLYFQIPETPLDKSNNYNSDHETNDASTQTDPSSLDFFAAPAQVSSTDLSVRGRLQVWVKKSENDSDTRIEFVPYSAKSEVNILQASKFRPNHILSPNAIGLHPKSQRIPKIPKTTRVQNILRFHQDEIPDHLKESNDPMTLKISSPRSPSSMSLVSDTWLDEETNTPRNQLDLQHKSKHWKLIQHKPGMIETLADADNKQKTLSHGENGDEKEHKIVLIKNLWRAKYMSDVDAYTADWKNKINPMHIVIDELDTVKLDEFRRRIDKRLERIETDKRLRRRMAGIRIVVLGPFRPRPRPRARRKRKRNKKNKK